MQGFLSPDNLDKEDSPGELGKGRTTVSANKSGEAMELTYELKGKATETDRFEVSDGGKTLTETVTYAGVSKPEVDVTIGSKGKAACA